MSRHSEATKKLWANPEWRARILASLRSQGEESSKNRSEAAKRRWSDPENKLAQSEKMKGTRRQHVLEVNRKRWADPESHVKQSKSVKRSWMKLERKERAIESLKRRGRYEFLDKKGRLYRFRSGENHELGVARWLDRRELTWEYEPHMLLLSDGRAYLPDFWVAEWSTYIEVKGRGWVRGLDKVELARNDGHPVLLVREVKEMETCLQRL